MAEGEFLRAEPRILVYEGGKVDDPQDPGGRTNQGVTQATYNAYRRSKGWDVRDVYLMENVERDEIYKKGFWDKMRGDELPLGLGFCAFDGAVNSGVGRSGIWLQQSLGDAYKGECDGMIGDKTMQAILDHGDVSGLIEEYCSRRLAMLHRLSTWSRYGKGWAARVSNVDKIALSWANGGSVVIHPVDVTPDGGHRKANVNDIPAPRVSQIATHITTAAGSAGTIAATTAQQLQPLSDTFSWMKYVFGGLTIVGIGAGITAKVISNANDAATKGTAKAFVNPDADAGYVAVPVIDPPAKAAGP